VRNACNGSREARSMLYHQFSKAMYNICIRMTGNTEDAEDVLQDAFIQAFKTLDQLKSYAQFGGWLKKIVVNKCIAFCNKRIKHTDWNEEDTGTIADENAEWWKTVDMQIVHNAIKALPEGCRQVFNLYVFEDMGHKQIAALLDISESTSKSQYHRARNILKQNISQYLEKNG
jgi:RNA polymerase sigma factor (sigma-70 family)